MPDIIAKNVKTGAEQPFPEPVFDAIEGDNEWKFVRYADQEPKQEVKLLEPVIIQPTSYQQEEIARITKPAENLVSETEDETLDKNLYYVKGPKKGQLKPTK